MGRRRKAREVVLQALYEAEFSDAEWRDILADQIARRGSTADTADYAEQLLAVVRKHREELDTMIRGAADNWDFDRISLVDRNLLRLSLAELLYFPSVPARVIIDEAVEIANKYSSGDAGRFVNGLLDRFARAHRQDDE